ncbi:MAG: glycan-binding surface protein [Bacteroidota bacterium]|nr:glycan-binding surface protein [Bacteroidota bacterium]
MKKLLHNVNNYLLLVILAAILLAQSGCKKDKLSSTGTPVITSIRNYVAHPGDSLLSSVGTGQWVVISGKNLKGALKIYFDGVAGSFNDAWFSDTSAIALIPSVIAFPTVPAKQLNTINYVTTHGQTTFSFSIVAPAPTISGISDEAANVGDSVKIYGFNFFFIKSLTYAGVAITNYTPSTDGTYISLAVPSSVTQNGGIVSVTTKSGSASTVYKVHDFVDGVFQNWDSINGYPWGSNTQNSSTDFPGNTGYYNVLTASNLSAGDNAWYNGGRGVNMNASQWVPVADIDSSLSSYAVKFELSVPKSTPWTAGSIFVAVNYSFTYIARYRPWINSAGKTTPFTTTGWTTVTIPLSSFLTNNGTGTQVASIKDLVGASGNTGMNIWFMNDGLTTVTAFTAAIDNIRVVKIK